MAPVCPQRDPPPLHIATASEEAAWVKLNEKVGSCKRHISTREIRQWCSSTEEARS